MNKENSISKFFAKQKLKNIAPNNILKSKQLIYANVNSIVIYALIQTDENHNHLAQYLNQLERINKKVTCFIYALKVKILPENKILNCVYINRNDLNFNYTLKSLNSINIDNEEFDLCIILDTTVISPLHILYAKTKAKFKVGPVSSLVNKHHDISIIVQENKDIKYLIEQIQFYLQKINTNTHE